MSRAPGHLPGRAPPRGGRARAWRRGSRSSGSRGSRRAGARPGRARRPPAPGPSRARWFSPRRGARGGRSATCPALASRSAATPSSSASRSHARRRAPYSVAASVRVRRSARRERRASRGSAAAGSRATCRGRRRRLPSTRGRGELVHDPAGDARGQLLGVAARGQRTVTHSPSRPSRRARRDTAPPSAALEEGRSRSARRTRAPRRCPGPRGAELGEPPDDRRDVAAPRRYDGADIGASVGGQLDGVARLQGEDAHGARPLARDDAVAVDRHRQHQPVVVVGVLADQVDPPRRPVPGTGLRARGVGAPRAALRGAGRAHRLASTCSGVQAAGRLVQRRRTVTGSIAPSLDRPAGERVRSRARDQVGLPCQRPMFSTSVRDGRGGEERWEWNTASS